jgi:heme A synthase
MLQPSADWIGPGQTVVLIAVLSLAALGTLALFFVAAVSTSRRRSGPYVLLTAAIGLLGLRSVVGIGTVLGAVPMVAHHLIEHGFDFLIALLVLSAIYSVAPPSVPD